MTVKITIQHTKVPILVWTDYVEDGALNQAVNVANLTPVYKYVALMPDVHSGYGLPVGGVAALHNALSPYMIGSDQGCGMVAVRTSLTSILLDDQKTIFRILRERIPVGFKHHDKVVDWEGFDYNKAPRIPIIQQELGSAMHQLGTLGGGNHFLEFQQDQEGRIWIMIHSGSRNIGKRIGDEYHMLAINEGVCPNKDLAYFDKTRHSDLFEQFYTALKYATDFAYENRRVMMEECKFAIISILGNDIKFDPMINIHHNYAEKLVVDGDEYWLHRKGATAAYKNTIGIIPGSMGSKSFIVKGLGNELSFNSCSHGAGRKMSRGQAKRSISKEEYLDSLKKIGLDASDRDLHIDEAPGAYKDIEEVMNNQKDLVEVLYILKPYQLPAIKG